MNYIFAKTGKLPIMTNLFSFFKNFQGNKKFNGDCGKPGAHVPHQKYRIKQFCMKKDVSYGPPRPKKNDPLVLHLLCKALTSIPISTL